jgi:hypothetical protein
MTFFLPMRLPKHLRLRRALWRLSLWSGIAFADIPMPKINASNVINSANGSVFYRLAYP